MSDKPSRVEEPAGREAPEPDAVRGWNVGVGPDGYTFSRVPTEEGALPAAVPLMGDETEALRASLREADAAFAEVEAAAAQALARVAELEAREAELRASTLDLTQAVDAVCDSDAFGQSATLEPHARSVLELALQRTRSTLADCGEAGP